MNTISDLWRESTVRVTESHSVSFLSCFVGFEEENLRVIIKNDQDQTVFNMNCRRENQDRNQADFETIKNEIWCQMPRGGKVFLHFGKNPNQGGQKWMRRKIFEKKLVDFLQIEIKRHVDFETHGDKKAPYVITIVQ